MVGSQRMAGAPDRTPLAQEDMGTVRSWGVCALSFPDRLPESSKQTQPVTLGQPSPQPGPQPRPEASTARSLVAWGQGWAWWEGVEMSPKRGRKRDGQRDRKRPREEREREAEMEKEEGIKWPTFPTLCSPPT